MTVLTAWVIPILSLVLVVTVLIWCLRILLDKKSNGTEKLVAFLLALTLSLTCLYYGVFGFL